LLGTAGGVIAADHCGFVTSEVGTRPPRNLGTCGNRGRSPDHYLGRESPSPNGGCRTRRNKNDAQSLRTERRWCRWGEDHPNALHDWRPDNRQPGYDDQSRKGLS
jgi:hypothetical protein